MTGPGAPSDGDPSAADGGPAKASEGSDQDAMFFQLYAQLRSLARLQLASERRNHTLQPTELVHDAWLRLAQAGASADSPPGEILAAAARAMRCVLIDHARARLRKKRGGGLQRPVSLDAVDLATTGSFEGILAVDEAIRRLDQPYPKAAEIVRLHFYVGLSMEEVAKALGMSERSVFREWAYARAWLLTRLQGDSG